MLLWAAPAGAQTPAAEAADEALQEVKDLTNGQGVRTGRELTLALAELAARRSDLSRTERRQANRILARPTDPGDDDPYLDPTPRSSCTVHFCVHWADAVSDPNRPDLTDGDADGVPNYVEQMQAAFEQAYQVENVQLGWRQAVSDGTRGGNSLLDVYIAEIGDENLYGYAAPEGSGRTTFAYQVMDNDYSEAEFGYDDPSLPMRVTAAHEYNHILQFAYDAAQDGWMAESTATWMEDKVFDADNDWYQYMPRWAQLPQQPMTAAPSGSNGLKIYGSAIWDHWIDRRCGPSVVRRSWEVSVANTVAGGGFAPQAYDAALREYGSNGFARELGDFAASTAEWRLADSGIREGANYPSPPVDVARAEDTLSPGGTLTPIVDHTAFVLLDMPTSTAAGLQLTGSVPAGMPGTIALVGRDGSDVVKVATSVPNGGGYSLLLADPARFDRITAVLVNASTAQAGYNNTTRDWIWTRDDQPMPVSSTARSTLTTAERDAALAAENAPETACAEPEPPVVTPTPTPTPTATPTVTATPTPSPTVTPPPPRPPTSVRLQRGSTPRLRTVSRKGLLQLFATVNKAGAATATASVDRKTAKRLKLGRTRKLGTGRKTMPRAGIYKVNVKLSRKVRRALRRSKRSVKLTLRLQFVPADGRPAVARKLTVTLKR